MPSPKSGSPLHLYYIPAPCSARERTLPGRRPAAAGSASRVPNAANDCGLIVTEPFLCRFCRTAGQRHFVCAAAVRLPQSVSRLPHAANEAHGTHASGPPTARTGPGARSISPNAPLRMPGAVCNSCDRRLDQSTLTAVDAAVREPPVANGLCGTCPLAVRLPLVPGPGSGRRFRGD